MPAPRATAGQPARTGPGRRGGAAPRSHGGARAARIRPTASPIGFPRVTGIDNLTRYCARLAEIGVLLLPGSVYDQPDHVRIVFGRANIPDALELLEANHTGSQ